MPKRIRISTTLIALGIAAACLSAPAFAAPGNSQAAVAAAKVKPKPTKPSKPVKPVVAPEIGAEGAAAALLLTIGGIAVMTGRRRRFPAP